MLEIFKMSQTTCVFCPYRQKIRQVGTFYMDFIFLFFDPSILVYLLKSLFAWADIWKKTPSPLYT